ncbi:MAG: flippase [Syntrophobacteraceae bacterium]
MSREYRKVPKNLLATGIGEVTGTILGFCATILSARYLGVDGFGRLTLYMGAAFVSWSIMEAGLMNILVRELSKRLEDPGKYDALLGAFLCLVHWVCGALFAIAGILALIINKPADFRYILLLLTICIAAMLQALSMASVVRAHEDMEYFSMAFILRNLFLVSGIIFVTRLDAGFLAIVGAWACSYIFLWLFLWVVVKLRYRLPRPVLDTANWKYILTEALPLGLGQIFRRFANLIDVFILRALSTLGNVGLFFCAYRFIMVLSGTAGTMGIAFLPVFSRLAANRGEKLDKGLEKGLLFLIVAAIPLTTIFFIYSKEIVVLFFGAKFAAAQGDLRLLSFTLLLIFPGSLFLHIFTATGKQRLWAFCTGACLLINASVDILLIPHLGHRGAVYGTMSGEVTQFSTGIYLMYRLGFKMSLHRLITRPLLAGLSVGVLLYSFPGVSLAAIGVHAVFAVISYGLLLWVLRVFTMKDFAALLPKRAYGER